MTDGFEGGETVQEIGGGYQPHTRRRQDPDGGDVRGGEYGILDIGSKLSFKVPHKSGVIQNLHQKNSNSHSGKR